MGNTLDDWKDVAAARDIEYENVRKLRREIHYLKMKLNAKKRCAQAIELQKKLTAYLEELLEEDKKL